MFILNECVNICKSMNDFTCLSIFFVLPEEERPVEFEEEERPVRVIHIIIIITITIITIIIILVCNLRGRRRLVDND